MTSVTQKTFAQLDNFCTCSVIANVLKRSCVVNAKWIELSRIKEYRSENPSRFFVFVTNVMKKRSTSREALGFRMLIVIFSSVSGMNMPYSRSANGRKISSTKRKVLLSSMTTGRCLLRTPRKRRCLDTFSLSLHATSLSVLSKTH